MTDVDGNTLLMITCQSGAFGLLPILLSKGCDVNARNNVGASCLHYACFAETCCLIIIYMLLRIQTSILIKILCTLLLELLCTTPCSLTKRKQ